ncbi:MAG: M6 family metalloprotease domain-containing protein, partial [candidate division WOR-3 bacterium]
FGIFGRFPHNSQGLVAELVAKADPYIDFSRFDNDHDKVVDGLLLVHAGPGAEETGRPTDIWSHKWQLSDPSLGSPGPVQTLDGVSVDQFSIQPERFDDGGLITVGVFCHEFGHILGLPDLYDTDYSSEGLGFVCLMAAGSWGRASQSERFGSSPVHPCAWAKYLLGWTRPESLERGGVESLPGARISAAGSAPVAFRILANPDGVDWTSSGTGKGEYFLVENRQRIGFDRGLPGSGLLILHIDEAQSGNDNERRPLVGILQADGSPEFALRKGDRGGDADLWKDSPVGVRNWTTPSTAFYDGVQSGVVVESISGSDSVMSARMEIAPLFLGRVYSFPNPVVVKEGKGQAIIVYQPTDSTRLANRFPPFRVRLFNIAGEPVRLLDQEPEEINREHRAAFWNLRNERGQPVKSGLFFYTVEIDEPDIREQNIGQLTIVR